MGITWRDEAGSEATLLCEDEEGGALLALDAQDVVSRGASLRLTTVRRYALAAFSVAACFAVASHFVASEQMLGRRPEKTAKASFVGKAMTIDMQWEEEDKGPKCGALWDQCGGKGYDGPTCCGERLECVDKPLDDVPTFRQCRPATCGKKWAQCGGKGFTNNTCCEEGLECVAHPLKDLPSFRQCRPIPKTCENFESRVGTPCWHKVMWDKTKGIYMSPQHYHGLTKDSSFMEFQEQDWMLMREKSQCPPPCGPGTCYFVLRYEGCDQHNEWQCKKNDGTLGYDCCCNKYHADLTIPDDDEDEALSETKLDQPSLFCVALMIPNSYEVKLLQAQLQFNLGMFACDAWAIVSNETVTMDDGVGNPTIRTLLMPGSLEVKRGGDFNTSLNTPIFIEFWNTVLSKSRALDYDWIIKLDPDTLFLPDRMLALLASKKGAFGDPEPEGGIYLNNCFLGLHGPLEVMSRRAMMNYKENAEEKCVQGDPAKHGQEDWFMRACFSELGVERVDAYNLLLEGDWACKERASAWKPDYRPACFSPQVAFHPFKDMHSYMHCWAEAVSTKIPSVLDPIDDKPTRWNERHG